MNISTITEIVIAVAGFADEFNIPRTVCYLGRGVWEMNCIVDSTDPKHASAVEAWCRRFPGAVVLPERDPIPGLTPITMLTWRVVVSA